MRMACLCLSPWIAGCVPTADDTVPRIRAQGFIRAGFTPEAPYALVEAGGRVGGESPEALRHALAAVGVDSIRWVLLDFDDLIPALTEGRVDVVASGLFSTPERRVRVRFSRPTLCGRPALLRRADAPPLPGLTVFAAPGAGRLAVVAGAVEHRAAQALGIPEARLLAVPDLATAVAAVRSGAADALALTTPTLRNIVKEDAALAWEAYEAPAAVATLVAGCSALAFRVGDARLAEAVDSGLARYLGSARHAGILEALGLGLDDVPAGSSNGGGR